MPLLEERVALVTGAGRGIGRQIALTLVREGAQVMINDLDREPAAAVAALVMQITCLPRPFNAPSCKSAERINHSGRYLWLRFISSPGC